jgi:hypothetical protein
MLLVPRYNMCISNKLSGELQFTVSTKSCESCNTNYYYDYRYVAFRASWCVSLAERLIYYVPTLDHFGGSFLPHHSFLVLRRKQAPVPKDSSAAT